MAWTIRGGKRYYYRSERQPGGKVVRVYLGGGAAGQLAAALDARRRRQRQARREAVRADREAWQHATAALAALVTKIDLLVRASLLVAGYRQHQRGVWRRRSHERAD